MPETIEYYFPQTELTYCSSENNQGCIKMLSNSFIPNGVWFGYIPDWVKNEEGYKDGFENKLARGSIGHDCIRDITKELGTWNIQNSSAEHPYKFKLVILTEDYRLYGWIKERLVTPDGKVHHLVEFSYLMNHKDQASRHFPDPTTLHKKEA